ncbi:MAG: NUDIX hydrolase [Huintestinicola sp.]
MKQLFEIDLHDYDESDNVYRRPSARGIIITDEKKIALVYSQKERYYKFPGGGIHADEDKKEAIIREVKEEVGLVVIPETIREFGSVMRRQKSLTSPHTIFEQENFYYFCKTEKTISAQELDDYELEAGFVLRYVDIDEAINVNAAYRSEDFFNEIMIKREMRVLQLIKDMMCSD